MKLARRIARLFRRQFDAAGASPRWPTAAIMASQPSAALAARSVLGRKASYLTSNAPIAASILNVFVSHLNGDGPSTRSNHPNRAMRRALEAAWGRFYDRADVEGGDLLSVLNRVVDALVREGECFVRHLVVDRAEPRLQLLPASQVDPSVTRELTDGIDIHGIRRDRNGRTTGYWVLPASPDSPVPSMIGPPTLIDAADIMHVMERRWVGQVRGLSWMAPVATQVLELDACEDAALAKAKVACLLAGFIRSLEGGPGDDLAEGEMSLEPGVLRRLRAGEDITFSPTGDFEGLNGFLTHTQRSICAGIGVPYELGCADLSTVNYSSAKLGLESFKRRCRALRSSVLEARLLRPVWERVVTLEILSGRLSAPDFERDPEPFFDVSFLWPEWPSLDPLKEGQSDVLLMQNGIRSRQEIIAQRGRDPESVDQEIQADTFRPTLAAPPAREVQNAA
jgi:lambda family phage portal protein